MSHITGNRDETESNPSRSSDIDVCTAQRVSGRSIIRSKDDDNGKEHDCCVSEETDSSANKDNRQSNVNFNKKEAMKKEKKLFSEDIQMLH